MVCSVSLTVLKKGLSGHEIWCILCLNVYVPVVILFLAQNIFVFKVYGKPVFSQSNVSKRTEKFLDGSRSDFVRDERLG